MGSTDWMIASQRDQYGLGSHMMTVNHVRIVSREGTYRGFSTFLGFVPVNKQQT